MSKLKATSLLWCLLAGSAASWLLLRLFESTGRLSPVLDYTALYSLGAVCAVVLFLGIRVKLSTLGKGHFEPIAAARTLVLAQAAAYAGAAIAGWHLAPLLILWTATGFSPTVTRALVLFGAGLAMVAIGYIVQHLCKLPPEDTDDSTNSVVTE
ncbi:DUF3180 domain-containing protein [Glutamicibacter sp.]|uniref:DUF3180 domain-containing protein n=1 Tax=Glutamicibacter sp. TaxID=1931995 RepID=UPI0028BDB342|nr:DUF3180 domain-containing protein [Glutamicibacter sp.]